MPHQKPFAYPYLRGRSRDPSPADAPGSEAISSGWEIASDVVGSLSAIALLFPAFGSNAIAKRIEQVRAYFRERVAQPAATGGLAAKSLTPDEQRMADLIVLAERLKQRWTRLDELVLRFAAVFLVASFILKGIHHWVNP